MLMTRVPMPRLRPFVHSFWASANPGVLDDSAGSRRERVLPTGASHVVFRLTDEPVRIHSGSDDVVRVLPDAVVGGPRSTFYVSDLSAPSRSVGVQLRPGVAPLLLGVPADELAERHTPLSDIWRGMANDVRERLLDATTDERRLDILESVLTERLASVRDVHPAVSHALARFAMNDDVGAVVAETGYSHRRFIALFRQATGLTPKVYCRVKRFQRVVTRLGLRPSLSGVDLALDTGHSDQSHLSREFRAFAGLTPKRYLAARPSRPNHLPLRDSPGPAV